MSGYFGLGKLVGKKVIKEASKVIKSFNPKKSNLGGKTVSEWKKVITNKKSEATNKQYLDEIRRAGAKLTGKVNQTAKNLEKLNQTLKKQKKILDD